LDAATPQPSCPETTNIATPGPESSYNFGLL
jgi:hypothetical protein